MDQSILKTLEQLEQGTPENKVIRLKSVFKQGKTTVQPVRDNTGWYRGIERLSEDQKKERVHWAEPTSKYVIKDGTTFDLNNEAQRITWEWVKHSPCICQTYEEVQFTPGAEFWIHHEGEEAQKSLSRKELKYKAGELIMKDNAANYPLRTKLLGVNMDHESAVVLKDYLLDIAEQTPDRIIKIYESHDLSYRLLFLKALDKGLIRRDDHTGIYTYGNTVLGMTEDSAVAWMQDTANKNLVEMLEREANPEYFVREPKAEPHKPMEKEPRVSTGRTTKKKD
jgi:hypothetical protein